MARTAVTLPAVELSVPPEALELATLTELFPEVELEAFFVRPFTKIDKDATESGSSMRLEGSGPRKAAWPGAGARHASSKAARANLIRPQGH